MGFDDNKYHLEQTKIKKRKNLAQKMEHDEEREDV